ncbi:toll/interleukin-1 receptor domain-containing protein [Tistrella sp. BH-R2-4]|uniref:Toll/interleukin-1 receptor domain-containing protein n=1 Tax=Tistrella arctica TaxID=3133430 RepID=A0ABU9YR16_9PROT|nr:toll/interleukin-1 receptor domain-containing protein [Mesorhizobium sediminum]NRC56979.1 toll/interleukin-1 receptor domain-containing protein [Mesorhizobium sediminum]
MSDVYIVYSRKDVRQAERLVNILSTRWEVWWDDKIVGDFSTVIEREIRKTKCIIPIWSPSAKASANVKDELRLAEQHSIPIVPAKIAPTNAPYGFGGYSAVDLLNWNGDAEHPGVQHLMRKISTIAPPREAPSRPPAIAAGKVPLPSLFLSVSSHETQLLPLEAVKALRVFGVPTILVSAYDLLPSRRPRGIQQELRRIRSQGGFVLVDSGNYEATRRGDDSWNPQNLDSALEGIPHDWAYCFDEMEPSRDKWRAVRQIIAAVERDKNFTKAPVLPIIHAPAVRSKGYDLTNLPYVVREVADQLQPPMIALAERELGRGLIERARTMRRIRSELDLLSFYQPVHLLGTGNPWSIAVLTAAGADSFDGLEWCRVAVDRQQHRLNHYQHFDFFAYQAQMAASPITVSALSDKDIDYAGKVAFHNLDYYREFTHDLQISASTNRLEAFAVGLLGQANSKQLRDQMPDLFK